MESRFWQARAIDMHEFRAHYNSVLKNITLNAEEKLIEAARTRAQQERTTLNTLFREWLARYTGRAVAPSRYDQLMRELKHVNSGGKFSREDLNER